MVRPSTAEVRPLPEEALVFDHVAQGLGNLARQATHLVRPGTVVDALAFAHEIPESRGSLEALGKALDLRAEERLVEARAGLEEALTQPRPATYLLQVSADLAMRMGDRKAALRWIRQAQSLGEGRGSSPREEVSRGENQALALEAEGRLEEAALVLGRLRGEGFGDLAVGLWEARLLITAGLPNEARQALESVTAHSPKAAEEDPRIDLALASILSLEGDVAGRRSAALRAVDKAEARGDRRQQALALLDLGAALVAEEDLAKARTMTEEARELARELESRSLLARCDNAWALVLGLSGQQEESEQTFLLSLEGFEGEGLFAASAAVLVNRGKLRYSWEDEARAVDDLRQAAAIYEEAGDESARRSVLRFLSRLD